MNDIGRLWKFVLGTLLCSGGATACDGFLEVELPGQLAEEGVFDPTLAPTILEGVISAYECGFSTLAAQYQSGAESVWWRATGFYGGAAEFNAPRAGNGGGCGAGNTDTGNWYVPYQGARVMGERLYERLGVWTDDEVPNRQKLMAETAVYVGALYNALGELFCEVAVDVGPAMTPTETLEISEEWLTRAIEDIGAVNDFSTTRTSSLLQLAHLLRARVRLTLGNNTGAASDAQLIQPNFVAWVTREPSVQERWNKFFNAMNTNRMGTIAGVQVNPEAGIDSVPFTGYRSLTIDAQGRSQINGLPVREVGTPDPRVPTERVPGAFTSVGPMEVWIQKKYVALGDDQAMARWAEAQLILAEIEGGQSAVNRINALRDKHSLPHFSSTDPQEIRNTIIEERRREFFLENRFWADKLRYDLWFPKGIGRAWPTHYVFGPTTCVLMPLTEYENNPNLEGDGSQFHQY
jgi:hypothetical protein